MDASGSVATLIRTVTVAVIVALTASGCIIGTGDGDRRNPAPERSDPYRGGMGEGQAAPPKDVDQTIRDSLKDLEKYWQETYPTLSGGQQFTPVRDFFPYTRSQPPPACGNERPEYQPNAFYCPAGDFIAWDAEVLAPKLYENFGPFLVAVVFAHEYGHAIQGRLGTTRQPTIVLEQQADCFAGSWAGRVRDGRSGAFTELKADQLDSTTAGLLLLRDQPGTPALAEGAHGNAFDRVRAFQDGFEQQATRCAAYRPGNIPVTEIPFASRQDAATGGNLPYDETLRVVTQDLQDYWNRTFPKIGGGTWSPLKVQPFDPKEPPACDGKTRSADDARGAAFYCRNDNFIAFDGVGLGPALHDSIGDNGVGTLIADLFAQAVQDRRGRPTEGRDAQLAIDCLAGTWTFDLLRRPANQGPTLSPGDLDEAVATLLALGRMGNSGGVSAFDRIAAFRGGVLNGTPSCA